MPREWDGGVKCEGGEEARKRKAEVEGDPLEDGNLLLLLGREGGGGGEEDGEDDGEAGEEEGGKA